MNAVNIRDVWKQLTHFQVSNLQRNQSYELVASIAQRTHFGGSTISRPAKREPPRLSWPFYKALGGGVPVSGGKQ